MKLIVTGLHLGEHFTSLWMVRVQ